jgi:GT2 family glycosyltransferase
MRQAGCLRGPWRRVSAGLADRIAENVEGYVVMQAVPATSVPDSVTRRAEDVLAETHSDSRVSVTIVTRDRRDTLLGTLERLGALPECPSITVVDNGSTDGTAEAIRTACPSVNVIALRHNLGAAARTIGVERSRSPYVAFSDDDSWWAPGALARAADLLDHHPHLGLIAARVLVGADEQDDPVCAMMASSPLGREPGAPGPSVLGFIACGSVVRRAAYLAAGGFHRRFGVGGEEELLATDLTAAGWQVCYVDDVLAHHYPSPSRDPRRRQQIQARNALWFAWLRRHPRTALDRTLVALKRARTDPAMRAPLVEALRGLPWIVRERRRVPPAIEDGLRLLDRQAAHG